MKKISISTALLLSLCLLLSACGKTAEAAPAASETPVAEEVPAEEALPSFECGVKELSEYGNLVLSISPEEFDETGIVPGDVVSVTVAGVENLMPVGTSYSDVDNGQNILRRSKEELNVAINHGDYASTYGIAVKSNDENGNFSWAVNGGTMEELKVTITLAEKDGYRDEYLVRSLERSMERSDYESDEAFANFRVVQTTGMGENILYRSSSPVYVKYARDSYADDCFERYGIRTVINMASSRDEVEEFFSSDEHDSPYYKSLFESGAVKTYALGVDYRSEEFRSGLASIFRFMLESEAPYMIHCNEGMNRTGVACIALEALMGAGFREIEDDYMLSYINFFKLDPESETYKAAVKGNFLPSLAVVVGTDDPAALESADLQAAAESYLLSLGLTENECARLKTVLSGEA